MMWIATLCLLAIAAWLFFNALNERRWVEAHSHDETVASDEGLLANFTALTRTANPTGDPNAPGEVVQTPLGRAVSRVQETTAMARTKFDEQRAAAARGEETVIGRTYSKVTAKDGVVRQTADKVATGIGALEKKVGSRLQANRARKAETSEDSSSK
ncbi:hypothetical protein ACUNV4_07355 [Granulosicoccus sp. 3-233]|uniref:hypothetical protein n=1 Tax=Granulosicoccus sp. 3-233 TaxID=3417969 RepID=UPI003D334194